MKPTLPEKSGLPPGPVYYLQPGEPPQQEVDEINLLDLWRVLVGAKWLILAMTALGTSVALFQALTTAPIYRADVTLAPADQDGKGGMMSSLTGQFGGLASLAGIDLGKGGANKSEEIIAVATSRQFTESFIKEKNLMPVLYSEQWDAATNQWRIPKPPTANDAYELFDKSIRKLVTDKKTGLTTLSIEWTDPKLTAEWANELVVRINANQKQEAIREAKQSIAYLERQLNETSMVEMRQIIYRLIESQTQRIMLANVREQFAFKVIDPAVVPEKKIKPKRALMVVLGFSVGLMLGVFSAFFRSFIRKQRDLAGAK
ncbi:MAG: Wzz/FepE/Etk N-terminal domain-containing protein [Gammaproteobacteria bacterium]|nr:Wzz/FepE/Etk N-terminal domain-containing protein [Gammaproteobacteria bacterium]